MNAPGAGSAVRNGWRRCCPRISGRRSICAGPNTSKPHAARNGGSRPPPQAPAPATRSDLTPSAAPSHRRAVRRNLAAPKGTKSPQQFRLGRAWPVGLQPTDSIRGHPRLGAVERKKDVNARIKSAQDDSKSFPASPIQIVIIGKFSPESPASCRGDALFLPVVGCRGKDGLAARRLRRPVERVGGRAPDGVVGCRPMRLECGLISVSFVEIVDVLVLRVLQNVEAQAARLVPLGTKGIDLDRLQETLA